MTTCDKHIVEIAKWASSHAGLDLDIASLSPLKRDNDDAHVIDSGSVFTVRGRGRGADYIIIVSNADFPDAISDAVERAQRAADRLPPLLAANVLLPLCADRSEEQSFAVYQKLSPFSKNRLVCKVQKLVFEREIYAWLSSVAKTTRASIKDNKLLENRFVEPLNYVANERRFSDRLREGAGETLHSLESEKFAPICILEHGDFWLGNILIKEHWLQTERSNCFSVIDWGASNSCGYPFVDLLRFYESTSNRMEKLQHYTVSYCERADIPACDIMHYTLAAVGSLGLHRNEFPMERYIALSETMAATSSRLQHDLDAAATR